jgi:hypothetical protein
MEPTPRPGASALDRYEQRDETGEQARPGDHRQGRVDEARDARRSRWSVAATAEIASTTTFDI